MKGHVALGDLVAHHIPWRVIGVQKVWEKCVVDEL